MLSNFQKQYCKPVQGSASYPECLILINQSTQTMGDEGVLQTVSMQGTRTPAGRLHGPARIIHPKATSSLKEHGIQPKNWQSCHRAHWRTLALAEGDERASHPSEWTEWLIIQPLKPCSLLLLTGGRGVTPEQGQAMSCREDGRSDAQRTDKSPGKQVRSEQLCPSVLDLLQFRLQR